MAKLERPKTHAYIRCDEDAGIGFAVYPTRADTNPQSPQA